MALVWTLPAVWCAGHVIVHQLDDGHGGSFEALTGDRIAATSIDHDHGHRHPDSSPMLSREGAKKLDPCMFAVAVAVGELESPRAVRLRYEGPALGRAARRSASISGPRAPPIS